MKTTRQTLLAAVEAVQPGVQSRDRSASRLAFRDGTVSSFNEEVCCRSPVPFDFRALVRNHQLLEFLRKLSIDDVEIDADPTGFRFVGRRNGRKTRTQLALEDDTDLPIDQIRVPTSWSPLPLDFADAVLAVKDYAGADRDHPELSCVRISATAVEAHDPYRVARYRLATAFPVPVLVRADSLTQAAKLGVCEYAVDPSWLHLRNPTGAVISCRRDSGEEAFAADALDAILSAEGKRCRLPANLEEALRLAGLFSADDPDNDVVRVRTQPGKFRVTGRGSSGRHDETLDCETEASLDFSASPKHLTDLARVGADCVVTAQTIRAECGPLVCCCVLMATEDE